MGVAQNACDESMYLMIRLLSSSAVKRRVRLAGALRGRGRWRPRLPKTADGVFLCVESTAFTSPLSLRPSFIGLMYWGRKENASGAVRMIVV